MEKKGIFYGVGVGPGDPEYMTLKAVRLIKENEIIAVPGTVPEKTTAYQIAAGAVPELKKKTLAALPMPMTHDKEEMKKSHDKAAETIVSFLTAGKNVVFLTLGDPGVYSTYLYLKKRVEQYGYVSETVSGIPSFCAAAAKAGVSLGEWDEQIHILPAAYKLDEKLGLSGVYVLMKAGKKIGKVKEMLQSCKYESVMVENCGMPGERIIHGAEQIPEDAGYYSVIIARKRKKNE